MNLDEFSKSCEATAFYPGRGTPSGMTYCVLGLCGESGEVAEKIKKRIRDGCHDPAAFRQDVANELGDVMFYAAMLAYELNLPLAEILQMNDSKRKDRASRGTLKGSGDTR